MIDQPFTHILLLLGTAVLVVVAFHRLRIPSSLGYLLVGVLLGPHTAGPVIKAEPIHFMAEFGIIFLLFTIGLNFSLPQIHGLRHLVLGIGAAQVLLTTLIIGFFAWLLGLSVPAAFVIGAVFAQSSTIIINRVLAEQGEEYSRHGRLGTTLSVFQDVTAVPLLIIIPAIGEASVGYGALAVSLGMALVKAVFAIAVVFLLGQRLLRPIFHGIAALRSAEIFTLTVLLVSLVASWITHNLGMSTAFGAFLAGMVLGETEFRHQVESTIRPIRDVLLGLFFVGIGMLFNLYALPSIWHLAVAGALVLIIVKAMIVAKASQLAGIDSTTAWRTGWILSIGGEFGFALMAIALQMNAIDHNTGQIALASVLLSMIVAPYIIRHNNMLARMVSRDEVRKDDVAVVKADVHFTGNTRDHVIICGYGRIGKSVAYFLKKENIPFLALDIDSIRVKNAHAAGESVYYGDAADRDILEAVGVRSARMVVVSHEDHASAQNILHHIREICPNLPVLVRTSDENRVNELRIAGATEVVSETLEAGLMLAMHALLVLGIPIDRITREMEEQRKTNYPSLRALDRSSRNLNESQLDSDDGRLISVELSRDSPAVGRQLGRLGIEGVLVAALIRNGRRQILPPPDALLEADDAIVLYGSPTELDRAERLLCTGDSKIKGV